MKKYKILHLPTATLLYSFSASQDPLMLFSELEAIVRIQNKEMSSDKETHCTLFTKHKAEALLKYCYENICFSFNDFLELKVPLYKYHIALIEVKDEKI